MEILLLMLLSIVAFAFFICVDFGVGVVDVAIHVSCWCQSWYSFDVVVDYLILNGVGVFDFDISGYAVFLVLVMMLLSIDIQSDVFIDVVFGVDDVVDVGGDVGVDGGVDGGVDRVVHVGVIVVGFDFDVGFIDDVDLGVNGGVVDVDVVVVFDVTFDIAFRVDARVGDPFLF